MEAIANDDTELLRSLLLSKGEFLVDWMTKTTLSSPDLPDKFLVRTLLVLRSPWAIGSH